MPSVFSVTVIADCGAGIGLGHLRRSLVIAKALQARGASCLVLTPSNEGTAYAAAAGMRAAPWPQNLAEVEAADILVADSYRFPSDMYAKWREKFRVRTLLDDNKDRNIDAEIVINGNLYGDAAAYAGWYKGLILAGPQYAPIDPEFFEARSAQKARLPRILISFGGTDDGEVSAPIATAILQTNADCLIDLVVSPLREPVALSDSMKNERRISIHRGGDMPKLMSAASLFVGGAGVSIMEAAAANVPTLAIQIAENQAPNIAVLKRYGVSVFDLRAAPEQIAQEATRLLKNAEQNPLSGVVSPGGPDRIADVILAELSSR